MDSVYKFANHVQGIDKKIIKLKRNTLPSMGRWEIARKTNPTISAHMENGAAFRLTLVVHEESYFVMSMQVSLSDDTESGTKALIDAVEKHQVLPEVLLVRDEKLFNELKPVADTLGFKMELVRRFRAIPSVLREMSRML